MRVISGKYKGKILEGFDIDGTRPTMDRVKESLFGMIQNNIIDSVCLDLFAGSGSLGIEALSNGASKCYFIDNNKEVIKILNRNLDKIENSIIIKDNYDNFLNNTNEKFDIIFLDPPYKTNELDKILLIINDNLNILNKDALIICETDEKIDYTKYNNLFIYKEKCYGSKTVTILKKH